jgi:hypothetical protein
VTGADRSAFTRPFVDALHRAKTERGLSQKQLGELIAARQHEHRPPGPRREAAIAEAKRLWPPRLSAWKKGYRLPATVDELCLAMDVITPSSSRRDWERRWRQARDEGSGPAHGTASQRPAVYLRQVERIAPPELIGRKQELAELAAFCLDETPQPIPGPYVWWRADAWAGKSALLSSFVLHPPAPIRERVRIVSFFVTARLASQNTREAFTQAVLEQLAHLGGRDLPPALGEATREAHLLDLLHEEAAKCAASGLRLILIVDGLDEDRGVTTGPDAHSIAALLPADPPAGMRVIVTGRPNPPISDDVPAWHPLCDPEIRRPLAAMEGAGDIEQLSQGEIRRLMHGSRLERDALLLITAARGGLSSQDICELSGAELVDVEAVLESVAGRTFTRRRSTLDQEHGVEVYQLGHEELHLAATRYLGQDRLADGRARFHEWAEAYREKNWPEDTPEYLVSSYIGLLVELNNVARAVAYATDEARHDRLLDITGGDSYAIAEIVKAQELLLLDGNAPDLVALARLALHGRWLAQRNGSIPVHLPQVLAKLGKWDRAEAMASAITHPDHQSEAFAGLARVAAAAGLADRAGSLAAQIEDIARLMIDPHARAVVTIAQAEVTAASGDVDRAQQLSQSLENSYWRARAVSGIARGAALAGYYAEARQILDGIISPFGDVQSTYLAEMNALNFELSQPPSRRHGRHHDTSRRIGSPGHHERVIADLATTAASVGDQGRTNQFVDMQIAVGGVRPDCLALAMAATALASVGMNERGMELANLARTTFSATKYIEKVPFLTQMARAASALGVAEEATKLAHQACQTARGGLQPDQLPRDGMEGMRWAYRATNLALAAHVALDLINVEYTKPLVDEAEACARRAGQPIDTASLVRLALALDGSDSARVERLLELAEASAQDGSESIHRELGVVAEAAALVGDSRRLAAILSRLPRSQATRVLYTAASAAADQGSRAAAANLLAQATALSAMTDAEEDVDCILLHAQTMRATGDIDQALVLLRQAEQLAESTNAPDSRAFKLAAASRTALRLGDQVSAYRLALSCHQSATIIEETQRRSELLAVAASTVADVGNTVDAYAFTMEIPADSYSRDRALAHIAIADATCGRLDRARTRALEISRPVDRVVALARVAGTAARDEEAFAHASDMAAEAEVMAIELATAFEKDELRLTAEDGLPSMDVTTRVIGYLLATVAATQAAVGETGAAERLIARIGDPFQRSRGLISVSEHVPRELARRCLAHVLAAGDWELCVPELGRLEPAAVVVIADRVFRQEGVGRDDAIRART